MISISGKELVRNDHGLRRIRAKRLRIGSLTDKTLRLLRNSKPLSAGIFGCQRIHSALGVGRRSSKPCRTTPGRSVGGSPDSVMSITSRLSAATTILSAFRSADNPNRRSRLLPGASWGSRTHSGWSRERRFLPKASPFRRISRVPYSRLGSTIVAGIAANWLAPPLGNAPWWDLW